MSIIVNRLVGVITMVVLQPRVQTTFGGSELAYQQSVSAITVWTSGTLTLIVRQWYLDRRPVRKKSATAR
ncbi:hypothetical protein [Amycolatopsis sp. NPDC051071]|uniref:hypothetical protein n=1 Tax=Amycolatopsis sp. NPDC051071 TaxID=3154637 RepID=UPI003421A3B5